jgi:hypothetical protein
LKRQKAWYVSEWGTVRGTWINSPYPYRTNKSPTQYGIFLDRGLALEAGVYMAEKHLKEQQARLDGARRLLDAHRNISGSVMP